MFGIMIQVQPCVSKYGNSALWPCHFGKYLLTVGGDEQQENAISPSILNVFVVHFLEHIPYTVAQKTAPMFAHFGKIGMVRSSDISKKYDIIT